jgi:hypothetical protein
MKTTIQAQHFHNTKMKNLTLHTKLVYNNKMSWNLKSQITQTRIISYPHNISNIFTLKLIRNKN